MLHGNIKLMLRTGQNSGTPGSSLQGKKPEELWQMFCLFGLQCPSLFSMPLQVYYACIALLFKPDTGV